MQVKAFNVSFHTTCFWGYLPYMYLLIYDDFFYLFFANLILLIIFNAVTLMAYMKFIINAISKNDNTFNKQYTY